MKPCDMDFLQLRIAQPYQNEYPHKALQIFAKNAYTKRHNQKLLQSIKSISHMVTATGQYSKNVSNQKINEVFKVHPKLDCWTCTI